MGLKCGIVGLPNVGKSTLFNALTQTAAAQAENFPFCTIEPNVGKVNVPDHRLDQIATLAQSQNIIPTCLTFVDIAGLVKGAAQGEGLGNKFLGNIRETDAIIHVLRCFEDKNITHVNNIIDPLSDAQIIETELMLADMETIEKRLPNLSKKIKKGDVESQKEYNLLQQAFALLEEGKPSRELKIHEEDRRQWKNLGLLTSKPVLYVCNVDEKSVHCGNEYTQQVFEMAKREDAGCVIISASIEEEIAQITDLQEAEVFLQDLNLSEPSLNRLIREAYQLLDLITYFTCGPKEARAWTISQGTYAPQAAGVIHSDFEKGFIRAETISFHDYIAYKGEQGAKEKGRMRVEGKEYGVQDGDILYFRSSSLNRQKN